MNFSYLLLFTVIGAALMFVLTWYKQGKSFSPKGQLPKYVAALIIGGLCAYFFNERVVQAMEMVAVQISMIYFIDWLTKFGKVPEPTFNVYGVMEPVKKDSILGWVLIGLFVAGWFFVLTAEGLFENHQTTAEIIGYGCFGVFGVICAVGFFGKR